jgi:putative aldouronate transport system permease protein
MISLLGLVIGFPATIVFALLLSEIASKRLRKTVQTISYLPYFVSMVVICGLVIDFLSSNGAITDLLVLLGLKRQNLLLNPAYFRAIYILSDLWQGLGYGSIVFLAAISSVNTELHEAAFMDGANGFQRVIHVTIPAIMPTIAMLFILRCGLLMTVGFDKILLLYNPGIYSTADVILTHVFRMGLVQAQFGYASAVGLFNSVIGTVLLILSNALARRDADNALI